MSLSVNGSNSSSNSYAYLQSPLQPGGAQSSNAPQSDPLSALLAALGQPDASPGGEVSSAGASTATAAAPGSGNTTAQFDAQTLQALLDLQTSDGDPSSQSSPPQPPQAGGDSSGSAADPSGSGTTTQTTTNVDGSTTTTVTYADGSTATTTTAAASDSSGAPAGSNPSAGGANIANNNLIGQLIQIQSQYLNPAATQSIATV